MSNSAEGTSWGEFIVSRAEGYREGLKDLISFEDLTKFANTAEKSAKLRGRVLTQELIQDEIALTEHASHVRTLSAHVVLLRDGLVPALQIDRDNQVFWELAIHSMAHIKAYMDAIEYGIL